MNLPAAFLSRMQQRLGTGFPAFLHAMEQPACRGVRVNPLKTTRGEFASAPPFPVSPVPWEANGFYAEAEKPGAFLEHAAGLYYCQEPSAMCAAPLLDAKPGERVLDLCAAPGGKTTQLAGAMGGEGVLIANEYVFERTGALLQNVERLGVKNCAVLSADSAALAEALPAYFDKILVDAPCSGEGMFRKDADAVREWSEAAVSRCAARQAYILGNAARMLRAGGKLVYSTCTFSEEENERQIEAFCRAHPAFTCVKTVRLMPHTVRGEGHFAALLERGEGEEGARTARPAAFTRPSPAAARAFSDFCSDFFRTSPAFRVVSDGQRGTERLFCPPEGLPSLAAKGVARLRAGVLLGTFEGGVFKPAHALAMSVTRGDVNRFLPLTDEECGRYLRGETVETSQPAGWCLVGVRGAPVGLGKIVGGVVKNHYPKGLRVHGRK